MPTFISYDGTPLAYHADGDGPPLVCLPGGPMRVSRYLGDLGGLTKTRRLIRLDLRGTGESAGSSDPATYRYDRQADDVEALRDHLGLESFDLLGHSAGASVALAYAAGHPARLAHLVLATPATEAAGIEITADEIRVALAARSGEPWYAEAVAAVAAIDAGDPSPERLLLRKAFTYGRWDDAARAHATTTADRNDDAAAAYYDGAAPVGAALTAVTAPVLVLAGDRDVGPSPRRAAELAAVFPDGRVVVQAGAAHYPWLDDPAAFTTAVEGFLGATR